MKRNKTILIAILVALLAVYLVLRLKGPEERLRPVYDLDSLSIESIEVFDQANTLKFTKNKGVWYLTEPVKWPADTLRINALFRNVFTAKYSRTPMGEGLQALKRFELQDSTALHIVVGGKGKKIHTMFSNMGNPYDYFRYHGSNEVYQIKTKVYNIFGTDLPNWRSPHVVNYYEDELLVVEVASKNNNYKLTRKGYDWHYQNARESFQIPANNLAIMKVVSILANLDTYIFIDDGEQKMLERFKNPDWTVKLTLSNNRKQELKFAKFNDQQFVLMVDNDPSVLFIVANDSVFRFTRNADTFKLKGYGL
ncbi:hypothetical protein MASR1M36_16470 [Candidatus Cloacimonadaceae bacterium]